MTRAAPYALAASTLLWQSRLATALEAREPRRFYVADRTAGTIVDVTFGDDYSVDPSISADGRYVAFHSHATNLVPAGEAGHGADVYVWDRTTSSLSRLTTPAADRHYRIGEISPSGRFVTYNDSGPWPDTLGDVFLRDRTTGASVAITKGAHSRAGGVATSGDFVLNQWPDDPPAPNTGNVYLRKAS